MNRFVILFLISLFFADCANAEKQPSAAYLVVNGINMEAVSPSPKAYFSAKENYVTLAEFSDFEQWREMKLKIIPKQSGLLRIELFSGSCADSDGKTAAGATFFDNLKINGEPLDNGDFERGFMFWFSENKNRDEAFKPKLIFAPEFVKFGRACARVLGREDQLSKNIAVLKDVPIEISVMFRRAESPKTNEDITVDISKFATADFVAATSQTGCEDIFKKFKPKAGDTIFKGIKFKIIDPDSNGGVSVMSFSHSGAQIFPREAVLELPAGTGGRWLYVLHTASNPLKLSEINIGEIDVETADGQKLKPIFVQDGVNIGDCWSPSHPYKCRQAYLASKKKNVGALYITAVKLPPAAIKSVKFSSYSTRFWSVFAATISEREIEITDAFSPSSKEWGRADIPENFEVLEGSGLDLSSFINTGIPAGEFGRAEVSKRGTICFENDKAVDARFKSFTFGDGVTEMFKLEDSVEKAKAYASKCARLTRIYGYNLVRVFPDGYRNYLETQKLDVRRDLLDFLYSEFKKNGVYVDLPLGLYDLGAKNFIKGRHDELKIRVLMGDAEAREAWKANALDQLTRVNKYTGLAPKDDPMFLFFEIYNELPICMARVPSMSGEIQKYVRGKWSDWLKNRYGSLEKFNAKLSKDGRPTLSDFVDSPMSVDNPDWMIFSYFCEIEFARDCVKIIRDIGYKGMIAHGNMVKTPLGNALRSQISDIVIINSYFAHPWKSLPHLYYEDICDQNSSIAEMAPHFTTDAAVRLNDRPIAVTEYAHAYWNKYRYENGVLFPSYAALQNFSVITLHGNVVGQTRKGKPALGVFVSDVSFVVRANEVLASAFFLRGDVAASPHRADVVYSSEYLSSDAAAMAVNLGQSRASFLTGIAADMGVSEKPDGARKSELPPPDLRMPPAVSSKLVPSEWFQDVESTGRDGFDMSEYVRVLREKNILPKDNQTDVGNKIFQSDTGQITMNVGRKTLKVVSDSSVAVALEKSEEVQMGAFKVLSTSVPAAIGLCSMDGKKLSESSRMLFIYSTEEANADRRISENGVIALSDCGKGPIVMRKGTISAELNSMPNKRYFLAPLAINGARREKIELPQKNGAAIIKFDNSVFNDGLTSIYEITAE